jgi:hypothetical protein
MLMAVYTGSDRVAQLCFTDNRLSGPYAAVMTCTFSPLLMTVECPWDGPFSEVVRRTMAHFAQSQVHARVPYDELVELVSRESFRRGQAVRTGSEVNFVSQPSVESRARRTRFIWNPAPTAWLAYGSDTYLRISELQDAVALGLHAASTVMDAEAMERFLRGYEAVLLAHVDPAVDLRVDEAARLAGFTAPAAQGPRPSTQDSGRLVARVGPASDAERSLATAVQRVNGLAEVSLSDSYTVAGGRVLRIPGVLETLRHQGWEGISVHQLAGGQPLRPLARRLTRVVG